MVAQKLEDVELVYDGQCPACTAYCQRIEMKDHINLSLVDARKDTQIMREITQQGIDIDQGMVLRVNDHTFFGSDAINELTIRSRKKDAFSAINKLFFDTPAKSSIFYPIGKWARNVLLRLLNIDDVHNLMPKNIVKHQLGDAWQQLHPNIQARFSKEPALGKAIIYEGSMQEMRRSFAGWLFASLTKCIGNPLSAYQGNNVPMEVVLFKKPNKEGVFWQRTYFLPDTKPYRVVSTKKQSKQGEMFECVSGGFGMKLNVYEENQSLHFKSYRYFWQLFKFQIPIPHWLTPGQTHVIHKDVGDGFFTYTIKMTHKQFGETFYQHGLFHSKGETSWN